MSCEGGGLFLRMRSFQKLTNSLWFLSRQKKSSLSPLTPVFVLDIKWLVPVLDSDWCP